LSIEKWKFSEKSEQYGNSESSIMKLAISPCSKIFVSLSLSKPVIVVHHKHKEGHRDAKSLYTKRQTFDNG